MTPLIRAALIAIVTTATVSGMVTAVRWAKRGAPSVRIEDEVLITNTGYRLLTDQFPRKLEDVEAWVAKAQK